MSSKTAYIIDVESGNLQSLQNAVEKLGWNAVLLKSADDFAKVLSEESSSSIRVFLPGVGNFGHFAKQLHKLGFSQLIKDFISNGGHLMGICVGLQFFFKESEESQKVDETVSQPELLSGLQVVNRKLYRFSDSEKSVPHIGWNSAKFVSSDRTSNGNSSERKGLYGIEDYGRYYFVNSYAVIITPDEQATIEQGKINTVNGFENSSKTVDVTLTTYGAETFISSIAFDNLFLTQFHPEKCGNAGLKIIEAFLSGNKYTTQTIPAPKQKLKETNGLTARIVACLDVRTNDDGDLVVTKGDQYNVREVEKEIKESNSDGKKAGNVRNLGKPVEMAHKYFSQGADEVTFLNITSFRNSPLKDLPMLEVLKRASQSVFVPLTVGGGIRDTLDPETGKLVPALDVATLYFRSGADKISIGSDAVSAAEQYYKNGCKGDGTSPIETISKAYGVQAVVVSVDPKRQYLKSREDAPENIHVIEVSPGNEGPNGEKFAWYQCTIKGGRELRPLGAYELVVACEALGAGEILLNCIDKDGSNSGYDLDLVNLVKSAVKIPVIASSGAGNPMHFLEVFEKTNVDAALGAGMFHRGEYTVNQVKDVLEEHGIAVRRD